MRIVLNESNSSLRCVPIMCFGSDGTTPVTSESGKTFTFAMGGVFYGSGGSLSAVSGVDGAYMACFAASKVSIKGHGMVLYSGSGVLPWMTPFEVVAEDPWTSQVTIHPGTYSTVTVRIEGVDYSGLTIKGVANYANISNVTLHAGTHSNVTIQGVSRLNSGVTLNAALHSGATVQGIENWANMPTLVDLTASSITSMAKAVVTRNIDNSGFDGRTVGSALAALRNKVVVGSSTITVYDTDDTTVLWGGAITTGGDPLNSVDPS